MRTKELQIFRFQISIIKFFLMHLFCREAKSVTCLVASKFIFFLVKQYCERGGEQEESDSEWEF